MYKKSLVTTILFNILLFALNGSGISSVHIFIIIAKYRSYRESMVIARYQSADHSSERAGRPPDSESERSERERPARVGGGARETEIGLAASVASRLRRSLAPQFRFVRRRVRLACARARVVSVYSSLCCSRSPDHPRVCSAHLTSLRPIVSLSRNSELGVSVAVRFRVSASCCERGGEEKREKGTACVVPRRVFRTRGRMCVAAISDIISQ